MLRAVSVVLPLLFACGDALGPDLDNTSSGSSSVVTSTAPTWYQDVGPLLVERCAACHSAGSIGLFSMDAYEDAQPWAGAIADAIEDGRMPPWAATETPDCTPELWFKDDPRLSADQIAQVREWADAGAPEGVPVTFDIPEIEHLTDPSVTVKLENAFVINGGQDIYQCFRIELPSVTEDVWFTDMEVFPDNEAVVHHVLVWTDPDNGSESLVGPDGSYPCSGEPEVWPTELVGSWVPGQGVSHNPPGTGSMVKAGTSLVVNVHYHPTGNTTELDQTEIAIKWTTEKPANYVSYFLVDIPFGAEVEDGEFLIPAGVKDHIETVTLDTGSYIPFDLPVFSVMPHMHYRGVDQRVTIQHAGDEEECLVETDGYRFDFQTVYRYDTDDSFDLPKLGPGDSIRVRCTYDNSWDNPFMADALAASNATDLIDVGWGEETGDEMCMAVVGFILPPIDLSDWL
jgi:hypothetical protein